jgi:hypothetical protein
MPFNRTTHKQVDRGRGDLLKLRAAFTAKLSKVRREEADTDPKAQEERQRIEQRLRCADLSESERTEEAIAKRALEFIDEALDWRHMAANEHRGTQFAIWERARADFLMEIVQRTTGVTIGEQPRRREPVKATPEKRTVDLCGEASSVIAEVINGGHETGGLFVRNRGGSTGDRWVGSVLTVMLKISDASAAATLELWEHDRISFSKPYQRHNRTTGYGIMLKPVDHLPVVLVERDQLETEVLENAPEPAESLREPLPL